MPGGVTGDSSFDITSGLNPDETDQQRIDRILQNREQQAWQTYYLNLWSRYFDHLDQIASKA